MEVRLNSVIGKLVERKRLGIGMSQETLARQAGMSRTYLSDIERGLRNMSILSLHKLCVALGTLGSQILAEAEMLLLDGDSSSN